MRFSYLKKVRRRVASLSRFQPFIRNCALVTATCALFPDHAPQQGWDWQAEQRFCRIRTPEDQQGICGRETVYRQRAMSFACACLCLMKVQRKGSSTGGPARSPLIGWAGAQCCQPQLQPQQAACTGQQLQQLPTTPCRKYWMRHSCVHRL